MTIRLLPLTNGKFAFIDNDDYDCLSKHNWYVNCGGYPARKVSYRENGKRVYKTIFMHRVVNKTPDGLVTDHVNGDKLDNRKSNLRSCTHTQNMCNVTSRKNTTSKYKGVTWWARDKKWKAQARLHNITRHLGYFDTQEEAALAFNKFCKDNHGEFARLNDVRTQN